MSILKPVFQSLSIKAFGPGLPAFGRDASWKINIIFNIGGDYGGNLDLNQKNIEQTAVL
jgi:hypothetical protein